MRIKKKKVWPKAGLEEEKTADELREDFLANHEACRQRYMEKKTMAFLNSPEAQYERYKHDELWDDEKPVQCVTPHITIIDHDEWFHGE